MPPGVARPAQEPLPFDGATPLHPLPKTPLIVMCLTFVALTLGLTLQVLFSSGGAGEVVDPARSRGVLQAEPHEEPADRQPNFPFSAVLGARWPGPDQPPGPVPARPPRE